MFTLGFSSLGCPDYDVDQLIELAARNGYGGVELRTVRGQIDLPSLEEFSPAQIDTTRRKFEKAGIAVVCLDSSIQMTSLDPDERQAQLAEARAYTAIAQGLGAEHIRVFGWDTPEGQDPGKTRRAIVEGLSLIAEESAERGVVPLVETHDSFSTGASVRELLDAGMSDKLGVIWDTFHTYRFGETPQQTWDLLGPRVRHIHVKDSHTMSVDEEFQGCLTGEGVVPFPEIIGLLKDVGYDRYVHFEWEKFWFPELEEPEVAIPQFARYIAELV